MSIKMQNLKYLTRLQLLGTQDGEKIRKFSLAITLSSSFVQSPIKR